MKKLLKKTPPPDDAQQAELARQRADAWARSPLGTPYGSPNPAPAPENAK